MDYFVLCQDIRLKSSLKTEKNERKEKMQVDPFINENWKVRRVHGAKT